jgi:beta-N-acetylhexosaminidase
MRKSLVAGILLLLLSTSAFSREKHSNPAPLHLNKEAERWAEKTLHALSLEEKIGQLFMVRAEVQFLNAESPEYLRLRDTIRKYHIGGILMTVPAELPFVYRNEPYEGAVLLNRLQRDSKLPLLVAADFERGITMRLYGGTGFPHAMAFGAAGKPEYAEAFGRITGEEARAIGVHWNFFPDADVNSNPANPIINTRSFGENPEQVGDLAARYIKGAHAAGMMTTAKHFPGHGDTSTDSHLALSRVDGDAAHLEAVELAPFRKAIASGVDAVMLAHLTVPSLEPDSNRVASTSSAIVHGLLQERMGFRGIVVTDALDMAGLTRLYQNNIGRAAVEAFKAGNDLLTLPADLDASYGAMLEAVTSGEIPQARVDASVLKLLRAKASLGLERARTVDLGKLEDMIAKPENVDFGQRVADEAITLVRDSQRVLPLKRTGTVAAGLPYLHPEETHNRLVAIIFTEDVRMREGRVLERQIRSRVPDANVMYVDLRIAQGMSSSALSAVRDAESVVIAAYIVPIAGKVPARQETGIGMAGESEALLGKILENAAAKTVVVAMGSPYLAQNYPSIQTYLCTFSTAEVSEVSAVKALFGEIALRGRLPVTIPSVAQRGAGIDRPAQIAQGGTHAISSR